MPKVKFEDIHDDLERRIVSGSFSGRMLPTEAQLVQDYDCSRNTVRRAIEQLAREGYVQSIRGRGVVILDHLQTPADVELDIRDFAGARSISRAKEHDTQTRVLSFKKVTIDPELAQTTSLPCGSQAYHLERLRTLDGNAWILDINYFLCEIVRDLTIEDAESSIYHHIEETLGYKIIASRRILSIQKATKRDKQLLDLDGCNCVGVIHNNAFIDTGRMFEYTESRYSPEHFAFSQFISR